ncbi:MAG: ribbon-helix-helix protein, CopG family [Candidatus Pacearchaeota archaeon]
MAKKVLSVTIDEKILESWKEYAEKECVNSSKLIEKMLREHLKKRGVKGG